MAACCVAAGCVDSELEHELGETSHEITWVKTFSASDWFNFGATVKLSAGNYLTGTQRVEYDAEVRRCFFDCATATYKVSIGHTAAGLLNYRASLPATGHKLEARVGVGTGVSLLLDGVVLPNHPDFGPFVLDIDAIIADTGAPEVGLYLLIDQQVLTQLPSPSLINGGAWASATPAQRAAAFAKWDALIDERLPLIDSFRFRGDLSTMNGFPGVFSTTYIADQITAVTDSGPAGSEFWHMHVEVNHGTAISAPLPPPIVVNHDTVFFLGGFFNGHRTYMRMMETELRAIDAMILPFGRLPVWNPSTGLLVPFTARTASVAGATASPVPAAVRYFEICEVATVAALHSAVNGWHGGVHGTIGGTFSMFHDAAKAPLFFPWHTAVDQLWANWQQCLL